MQTPLISAHRGGASSIDEENRRETFLRAASGGCDAIEFDVHRTSDDCFVLAHDETIDGHPIASMTLEQVKDIDPQIMQLHEAIDIIAEADKIAHVDFKFTHAEIVAMEQIDGALTRDRYVITTREDSSLRAIRDEYGYATDESGSSIRLGLSLGNPDGSFWERFRDRYLAKRRLRACGADVIVSEQHLASSYLANVAVATDRLLLVWTPVAVDDIKKWLDDDRCWMLTTNDVPTALRERSLRS